MSHKYLCPHVSCCSQSSRGCNWDKSYSAILKTEISETHSRFYFRLWELFRYFSSKIVGALVHNLHGSVINENVFCLDLRPVLTSITWSCMCCTLCRGSRLSLSLKIVWPLVLLFVGERERESDNVEMFEGKETLIRELGVFFIRLYST